MGFKPEVDDGNRKLTPLLLIAFQKALYICRLNQVAITPRSTVRLQQ